jgi:hypothetical protein
MANTIQHKRSSTATTIPTSGQLLAGELAVNTADGKLFLKKDNNSIVQIGTVASGSSGQVQFNSSGTFAADAGLVYSNGTAGYEELQVGSGATRFLTILGRVATGGAGSAIQPNNALDIESVGGSEITIGDASGTYDGTKIVVGSTDISLSASTIHIDGVITGSNTTASTSSATGALIVSGGVGVAKDSHINSQRIGVGLLQNTTNLAVGANTLAATITGGINNTAIGSGCGSGITSGSQNTFLGYAVGTLVTTGAGNCSIGYASLNQNIGGNYNTAMGYGALQNTTASNNTAVGIAALQNITTGALNTAVGREAGCFQADGTTALTTANNSVYLGRDTRGTQSDSNSVVIGYQAIGLGANTTVLGNSSTTAATVYGVLTPSKGLLAPAGTTAIAPIKLQSGTNLTTPTSGVVEFDGKAMYGTVASGRGLIPTEQFSIITTTKSLTSSTAAQNIFDTPEDTITLALDTAYSFEGFFSIVSGTTSHTTAITLVDATAGSENISWRWMAMGHSSAAGTVIRTQDTVVFTTNGGVITASSTSALTTIWCRGVVIVTSAGATPIARNIVPKITFSAAPTNTNQVAVGSFIRFVPLGSNLVKSVGPWS